MPDPEMSIKERVTKYKASTGKELIEQLGFGHDGDVYSTSVESAVKFFGTPQDFRRELAVYQRLKECGVDDILGHAVPVLLGWDEDLLVLEMTIVRKPFLLDFASAYLDWPPDFSPEVLAEWGERKAREFGAFWPRVQLILAYLGDQYGIYLTDIHRGNIAFESDVSPDTQGSP